MTQHPSFQSVARRAALVAAATTLLIGLLVLMALYAQHRAADERRLGSEIESVAAAWQSAGAQQQAVLGGLVREDQGAAVLGADGQTRTSAGLPIFGNSPDRLVEQPGEAARVESGGASYLASAVPLGEGRLYYARAVQPWPFALPLLALLGAVALAGGAAFWFVRQAVGASSAAAAEDLAELARRVAGRQFSQDAEARLKIEATERFGSVVEPLFTMSEALTLLKGRVTDAESRAQALLQVNPHYVVLVGTDGKVADANSAFFAMSGLPAKKTRGASVKILDTVMPLDPLAQHAARAASGATVQGIDYVVTAKGGRKRRVKLSMRKARMADADILVIQATDIEREHELQHQVDDFFDTFDLKVDERIDALQNGAL